MFALPPATTGHSPYALASFLSLQRLNLLVCVDDPYLGLSAAAGGVHIHDPEPARAHFLTPFPSSRFSRLPDRRKAPLFLPLLGCYNCSALVG